MAGGIVDYQPAARTTSFDRADGRQVQRHPVEVGEGHAQQFADDGPDGEIVGNRHQRVLLLMGRFHIQERLPRPVLQLF